MGFRPWMKPLGVGMDPGRLVAKRQVEFVGFTANCVAGSINPVQPLGVIGVPKAERAKLPWLSGPMVEYGLKIPYCERLGTSLKSPARMRTVGTVSTCVPIRCRMLVS